MKHEVPTFDGNEDWIGNSKELYDYWKLNEGSEVTVELREAP